MIDIFYHLPNNLTVVRINVIKVIKLMQGCLMHASHPAKSRTQHCQCLLYVCECYVCVGGSVGCGLKVEHGNIMDVLEEKKTIFFCSQRYESFPSPKTAYSYLLK